jgi:hypothetical protein
VLNVAKEDKRIEKLSGFLVGMAEEEEDEKKNERDEVKK